MRSTFQEVAITMVHNRVATSASLSARCVALAGDTTARTAAVLDATAREAEGADDARQELRAQRALPAETSAAERLPSAAIPLSESEAVKLKTGYLFKENETTLQRKQHWSWCVRPRCARPSSTTSTPRPLSLETLSWRLHAVMLRCVHRTP